MLKFASVADATSRLFAEEINHNFRAVSTMFDKLQLDHSLFHALSSETDSMAGIHQLQTIH